jgi:hypothetical protein
MGSRHFTVIEANEALDTIRPLAEEMVRRRRTILAAEGRRAEIALRAAGNGAGLNPKQVAALDALVRRERDALARCVSKIQAAGAQVKDLDTGLLDFPAWRGNEEILLCWKVGEPEVGWWHGEEEGFAGRKPLPFE